MTDSLPLSLVISWITFFGFVNTYQRHATLLRSTEGT